MQARVDAGADDDRADERQSADHHPLRAPTMMRDLRRGEGPADRLRIFQHLDELGRGLWTIDGIDRQTARDHLLQAEWHILAIHGKWTRRLSQSRRQHLA